MNKIISKCLCVILVACFAMGLTACGQSEGTGSANTEEVANDYYIDLTDLGMKLTIYLRLDGEGNFIFSNTLAFETNKSSGTFQKSGEEYIMVYSSVNGEEKSISDGLTSSFAVMEDGNLDFSGCDRVYYGSASPITKSEDNPDAIMKAKVVPENYEEPDSESEFQTGVYATDSVSENGVTYSHIVSFYEDKSYLHLTRYEQNGQLSFDYESGTYGISTTQLALEPEDGERTECEVVNNSNLKLSILPYTGATERMILDFVKIDAAAEVARFAGTGNVTGSDEIFEVTVVLYDDGSYESTAAGFTETGVLAIDSLTEYVKQYPDHPETEARGLTQVATVPYGSCLYENGKLVFTDMRVRTSENLTRYQCTVTE